MPTIAFITPHAWMNDALWRILVDGAGLADVWQALLVLTAAGLAPPGSRLGRCWPGPCADPDSDNLVDTGLVVSAQVPARSTSTPVSVLAGTDSPPFFLPQRDLPRPPP